MIFIAAPLALCESEGLSGKDLILATAIAYEIEMRLCEVGRPGIREYGWHHATLTRNRGADCRGTGARPFRRFDRAGHRDRCGSHFCSGAVTAGKFTNMKNTVDPWAARIGVESALLGSRRVYRDRARHRWQGSLLPCLRHARSKGEPSLSIGEAWWQTCRIPRRLHYRILDCGMKSFPIEALSHAPLTAMMKAVKEHNIKADEVKEIKVEVIARAADILGDPHGTAPTPRKPPTIRCPIASRRASSMEWSRRCSSKKSGCSTRRSFQSWTR